MASTLTVDNIVGATAASKVGIPGHVLQVVQATITSQQTTTSTSFVDSGLTATITPTSSSSKILVTGDFGTGCNNTSGGMIMQLVRGSTSIFYRGDFYSAAGGGYAVDAFFHLDSPATTSATTYKIQFKSQSSSTTVYVNTEYSGSTSPTSHITLMEIGQ